MMNEIMETLLACSKLKKEKVCHVLCRNLFLQSPMAIVQPGECLPWQIVFFPACIKHLWSS